MKIFIGIVNYNRSCFLREQIARINRYLLLAREDKLDISVADNSSKHDERRVNKSICDELGIRYMNYDFSEGDPSLHHSISLNALYQTSIEEKNDFSLFFDHDTFMYAPSNIIYDSRDKHFAGIGQAKMSKMYLHPNVLLINNKFVPRQVVDFKPCYGMDTGGRMADYIGTLTTSQIKHLKYEYGNFTYEGINDIYELIDESFFHMIKGSNWNNNPKGEQRQEFLLEELQKISK